MKDTAYCAEKVFGMKCVAWTLFSGFFLVLPLHAATRYVWDSCPTPIPPYTVWSNAAVNIQDAVDVSSPGDLIRVTNGTYSSAGAAAPGHTLTNRVCLTNGITVSSVNGPAVTIIQGAGPIGSDDSRRAAYVGTGSVLLGFTLTDGHTKDSSAPEIDQCGGGVLLDGGLMSNCVVQACAADLNGGGAFIRGDGEVYNSSFLVNTSAYGAGMYFSSGGYVSKCVISNNTAAWGGGGAFFLGAGYLHDSDVMQNYASGGSGLYFLNGGTADDCRIFNHPANDWGGGIVFENSGGVLSNCFVYGNSSAYGGGIYLYYGGMVDGCTVSNNSSSSDGGGAYFEHGGVVQNCLFTTNTAANTGGGIYLLYGGSAIDCSIHGNGSAFYGGGVFVDDLGGVVSNCNVSDNRSDSGAGLYLGRGGRVYRSIISRNVSISSGGGLYAFEGGYLENCLIDGNQAGGEGGGGAYLDADAAVIYTTVSGNYTTNRGGGLFCARDVTNINCIVYANSADVSGDNWATSGVGAVFASVCTTPLPSGSGNFSNNPAFVNIAISNYNLSFGSPCIDAADPSAAPAVDLPGGVRPLDGDGDGTNDYDIGCYEYNYYFADSNQDGIPDGWYIQYGLNPIDEDVASEHADGDPFDNGSEYVADTNPTNPLSYFYISTTTYSKASSVCSLTFNCSTSRVYDLEYRNHVGTDPWIPAAGRTNVPGAVSGSLTLTDTNSAETSVYRVGVRIP